MQGQEHRQYEVHRQAKYESLRFTAVKKSRNHGHPFACPSWQTVADTASCMCVLCIGSDRVELAAWLAHRG